MTKKELLNQLEEYSEETRVIFYLLPRNEEAAFHSDECDLKLEFKEIIYDGRHSQEQFIDIGLKLNITDDLLEVETNEGINYIDEEFCLSKIPTGSVILSPDTEINYAHKLFQDYLSTNHRGAVLIDPPNGYKYGFPKYASKEDFAAITDHKQWCIDNGYPLEEALKYGDIFPITVSGDIY